MMKKILFTLISFVFLLTGSFAQDYETEFQGRADFIKDLVYDYGWVAGDSEYRPAGWGGCTGGGSNVSDFGKYIYPWLMAHLEADGDSALSGTEREKLRETFENRIHLCPTFHFNLAGLPRLLLRHGDFYIFQKNANGGRLEDLLERVFERTDSYNAWTAEGTENHINMSRLPGYLYAQIAIDSGLTAQFPTASAMLDSMKNWIMEHSKTIYQTGASEWNSSTYGVYNIMGWIDLYDFAHDPDVVKAARAMLDYYAAELALHYTQGFTGGAEMRGGGASKSINTETDYLAWLWFGDSPKTVNKTNFNSGTARQSMIAATSSYRPPIQAVQLARKELQVPSKYYNHKSGYLYEDPGLVQQTFYIDKAYTLGAAYTPYGGWGGGDWQIISWKMVSRVDSGISKDAQFLSPLAWTGYVRPQFRKPWEQFVHHENVMIQMTKRPTTHATIKSNVEALFNQWELDWQADFDQRFPTDTDKGNPVSFQSGQATDNETGMIFSTTGTPAHTFNNNILFIEFEKSYIAIRSIYNTVPSTPATSSGYNWIRDNSPDGTLNGLIIEIGNVEDFASFADFQSEIINNTTLDKTHIDDNRMIYTSLRGDVIDFTYESDGTFTEPIYDWGYGPTSQLITHRSPPFVQPDWSSVNQGQLASYTVNGSVPPFDPLAVYSGENIILKNNILKLINNEETYQVDYTGDVPVFGGTLTTNDIESNRSSLWLYPNPAKETFTIEGLREQARVSIYTISGKLIKNVVNSGEPIAVTDLTQGVYIVVTESSEGKIANRLLIE